MTADREARREITSFNAIEQREKIVLARSFLLLSSRLQFKVSFNGKLHQLCKLVPVGIVKQETRQSFSVPRNEERATLEATVLIFLGNDRVNRADSKFFRREREREREVGGQVLREGERKKEKRKKERICLPRRCFHGCPKCAAICRSLGHQPDTVYLSPIRCTSANTGDKEKETIAVILGEIEIYIYKLPQFSWYNR